jgi:cell division protein FtsL
MTTMERTSAASAIGYQVRKDIRNRPYRERDRVGDRRLVSAAALAILVVGLLMGSAWIRYRQADVDREIVRLTEERLRLVAEERHWRAELESLAAPARISDLATGSLHMIQPSATDVVVLERAQTSPAPSSAVVAKR